MKNKLIASLFLSLTLFSCSGAVNNNLWDRTFKSTGKTFVDYNIKINGKNGKEFLKENYYNIIWSQSGPYNDYYEQIITPFNPQEYSSFDTLIRTLDTWWISDSYIPGYRTFSQKKTEFDHCTFILKKDNNNLNEGVLTIKSDIVPSLPSSNDFYAKDVSVNKDGSLIKTKRRADDLIYTGYIRTTNVPNVVNVRSGPYDDSIIEFRFTLYDPVGDINHFSLYNYIEIKEYHYVLPWWAITLIVIGSLGLVYIVYLIIKRYRRYHHKY